MPSRFALFAQRAHALLAKPSFHLEAVAGFGVGRAPILTCMYALWNLVALKIFLADLEEDLGIPEFSPTSHAQILVKRL